MSQSKSISVDVEKSLDADEYRILKIIGSTSVVAGTLEMTVGTTMSREVVNRLIAERGPNGSSVYHVRVLASRPTGKL